jgi:hypothetical protein
MILKVKGVRILGRIIKTIRIVLLVGIRIFKDTVALMSTPLTRRIYKVLRRAGRKTLKTIKFAYKFAHHYIAHLPHLHLMDRWRWYNDWHNWNYHKHVHSLVLTAYTLVVLVATLVAVHKVLAADLIDTWDFTTPSDFTLDSGLETSGTSARMKALNYVSDANTAALYHLDEPSGTTATDSSSNSNTASVNGSANWVTGNLNNAFSFGATTNISAPDSASLSLTQTNSLEAWTKFNSSLSAGSHDRKQGIIDKGAYKLYYDQETGKVTYELTNSSANSWSQKAGSDINNSWDLNGKFAVNAQVAVGSDVYVGLGNAVGDAEVWKWNGSVWSQIGGDGVNSSWADQVFENVLSLEKIGNTLYAGLGSNTGDAEVWSCDTTTSCSNWTKIGGDGVNSSWAVSTFEEVNSMVVMGTDLYVGLGQSSDDARIYKWDGAAWTWVGGFGVGGPYNAFGSGYEAVYSLTTDGSNLYAGLGNAAGDADVWKLVGTTWTQIGGDATNSSWAAATYESVLSLRFYGGNLYAGTGLSGGDAEVWVYNGSSWTQIGGDTLNSSWDSSSFEGVYSLTDDGTNLYAGLGSSAGDNEVWKWDGINWSQIGGDGVNSGFTNTHTIVQSLLYTGGTLYAGLQATANNAEVWSFNGSSWTLLGGGYVNKSWGFFNLDSVQTMTESGGYLYAGTGSTVAGNATVWRFDGSSWQIIGGQAVNSSWAAKSYENVVSMVSFGGNLCVGLGTSADDAEVWQFNGSSWTKIGGDSVNSGWGSGYEEVNSLAVLGGNLYAGLGNSANDAEVWAYNGSSWTKIGGDSLNSGWGANFERVSSLTVYDGQIYAGLGSSTTDAEVWGWNGSAWSKIGGDGTNSSWNTSYEQVESLLPYNGKLYAGLGNSTADAEVWEYNGTVWSKIGGDGTNSSWIDGQYEQVKTLASYNGLLYAGLGNNTANGEVWVYNNGTWSKVGGGLNSSWPAGSIETVNSLSTYHGKLYAGLGNGANSDAQVWAYGNNAFLQSSTSSQDTNWHHIAASYDGTTMKIYIDGTLNASVAALLYMPDTAQPLLVGSSFGGIQGSAQGNFDGLLDEVRISNIARSSFTAHPYSTTGQTITLNSAVRISGVWHWDTYDATETANGGTITYRLSDDDGSTWKYWNGSAWVTSANTGQSNSAAVLSANITTFPVTFDGIKWQAVLLGNGDQRVTLDDVTLQATSDLVVPSAAGVTISALRAAGGSVLNDGEWTNGSSPYFSWNDGSDGESGIKGYCAYIGTDDTADPITTKGILGNSPVDTGGHCQFIVGAAELDLATPGYLGSPLTSSGDTQFLTIKAIDNSGNVSDESAQFSFRFDNTPPINPSFASAPAGYVNNKQVEITWPTSGPEAPDDVDSGLLGLQYRIGSSGTWYGDSHTGLGDINDLLLVDGSYITQDPPDFDDLNEGINTVYLRTWDIAGNVTTTYVTATVKISTSGAPSEPLNLVPTPDSSTVNSFAFDWDAPEIFIGSVNNISYCYTVNAVPSALNCTYTPSGQTSLAAGPYATQPGINTFYVAARDEAGNINYANYVSITFTANTTAPGMPLNLDVTDVSIKATSNWRLALAWDPPTDPGSGVASYQIFRSTDNSIFNQISSTTSTSYIDEGLSQQRYYYRVRACDNANNCGANSAVDDELPVGSFTSPANLVSGPTASNISTTKATISWSTDRNSDSMVAIGTSSGSYGPSEIGTSTQVTAHEVQLTNLSAGTTYYLISKWTDEDGNTGQSSEISFTTAPAPTFKDIVTIRIGLTTSTVSFTTRNASKVSIMYGTSESFGNIKTVNTATVESTYTIDLSSLLDGTEYFFKLVAYDAEGTAFESSIFSFKTPPKPRITNLTFQPVDGEPTSTQRVSWLTNVPATSSITFGKVGTDGVDLAASQLVTHHELTIRNLEDDSQYFLIAQSRDGNGNLAVSERQEFHTALDTRPPNIENVSIESSIRGTGAEARGQVIVSWRTDELATSQVAYAEGSDTTHFNNRTAEDSGLSFEHIVIVSDLPTSKVYTVQPISRDKTGNSGNGQAQPAIIGRASDSVLTIVLETLKKIFGF